MRPSLSTLPQELFDNILNHVFHEPQDTYRASVCNLRITSRALHEKSEAAFIKANIRTREVSLTTKSLQSVLALSQHQNPGDPSANYASLVRTVIFERKHPQNDESNCTEKSPKENDHRTQMWEEIRKDRLALERSGIAPEILGQAFQRMPNIKAISIFVPWLGKRNPGSNDRTAGHTTSYICDTVLGALSHTGIQLDTFEVQSPAALEKSRSYDGLYGFVPTIVESRAFSFEPLRKLSRFKAILAWWFLGEVHDPLRDVYAQFFEKLLQCPLKELHITIDRHSYNYPSATQFILGPLSRGWMSTLTHITLCFCIVYAETLRNVFSSRRGPTLRSVALQKVLLWQGSWVDTLSLLRSELSHMRCLESLMLFQVGDNHRRVMFTAGSDEFEKYAAEITKEDDFSKRLDGIIEAVERGIEVYSFDNWVDVPTS